MNRSHRNTICVENAEVLAQATYPSEQFILRMFAPECAKRAVPGCFVHIRCDADIPMRRPLSIMRVNVDKGWIEVLYKIVGAGLLALSRIEPGDTLNILGPIGNGFALDSARPLTIMIGGGVGIPPLLFLGEHLHTHFQNTGTWGESPEFAGQPVAFFGSEIPFPFVLEDNARPLPGAPANATAAIKLMENWMIPSRLATTAGYPGMLRRVCNGPCEPMAGESRRRDARTGFDLRLRSRTDAQGRRHTGPGVRRPFAAMPRRIYGLRRRRMRGLRRRSANRKWSGDAPCLC